MADTNRLVLHTVHDDDGATELYFSRSNDDHVYNEGILQFRREGGVTFKACDGGEREVHYNVTILKSRTVITVGEDQPTMAEIDEGGWDVVFDSADLKWSDERNA